MTLRISKKKYEKLNQEKSKIESEILIQERQLQDNRKHNHEVIAKHSKEMARLLNTTSELEDKRSGKCKEIQTIDNQMAELEKQIEEMNNEQRILANKASKSHEDLINKIRKVHCEHYLSRV